MDFRPAALAALLGLLLELLAQGAERRERRIWIDPTLLARRAGTARRILAWPVVIAAAAVVATLTVTGTTSTGTTSTGTGTTAGTVAALLARPRATVVLLAIGTVGTIVAPIGTAVLRALAGGRHSCCIPTGSPRTSFTHGDG